MATAPAPARVVAVLGPTNTGKTHRAVERMLEHETGMIGLPLRLLAREVYDRISARTGERAVALVTGEEKRVPRHPKYWVCTVEAMPVSRAVDFLAVDEIQLATHHARGHVFTDRLLHARGRLETWFMGADTMRPRMHELIPEAELHGHERLSTLRYTGNSSLGRLPPRSAVVTFSVPRVYELAERIRVRRGGAAVVLGALSPRARNAQAALYQSGEVDYMVATDAIGMGLNMDVHHVAFADLTKFDGRETRPLAAAELAQIAGRAGRYLHDGTFGVLKPVPPLPPPVVESIETHRFPAVRRLFWRSDVLDFSSIDALVGSLRQPPPSSSLHLVKRTDDLDALVRLAASPEIRRAASPTSAVSLLWDVCRVPDYRQLMLEDHVELLSEIFLQLTGPRQTLAPDWMARRIARVADADADIDTLLTRMAFVRTWTYISHQTDWVADARHWQERTRAIEDTLSDALHERLVERFVDRRRTRPAPKLPATEPGTTAGTLTASPFAVLEPLTSGEANAEPEPTSLETLDAAPHSAFEADPCGDIWYEGRRLGRMTPGQDLLHPDVVLADDVTDSAALKMRLKRRLVAWTRDLVGEMLEPVRTDSTPLSPEARGVLYQLEQGLGTTPARPAREQVRALERPERTRLEHLGVRFGRRHIYWKPGLKPTMVRRRLALLSAYHGRAVGRLTPDPAAVSIAVDPDIDPAVAPSIYLRFGFPVAGPRAIRADVLERLYRAVWREAQQAPFVPSPLVYGLLARPAEEVAAVIEALGFRRLDDGRFGGVTPRRHRRRFK